MRERKGLSFGVRKTFMTMEDGSGVVLVPEPPNEAEDAQQQVLSARRMKHTPPDIQEMTRGKLDDEIVRILKGTVDCRRMTDEVAEFWETYAGDEAGDEAGDRTGWEAGDYSEGQV